MWALCECRSKEVEQVLLGRGSLFKYHMSLFFFGCNTFLIFCPVRVRSIFILRKLCNHPDLLQLQGMPGKKREKPAALVDFGNPGMCRAGVDAHFHFDSLRLLCCSAFG
jgi:hypothetical protein